MIQQKQRTDRPTGAETWITRLSDKVWAPVVSVALMLLLGGLGLAAHQPWLFPSLGPTVFLQAEQPNQPTARLYNTIVGHLLGLAAGLFSVAIFSAANDPALFSSGSLTPGRVGASALAVGLNMLLGLLLKASHPPAAATTLIVALGGFKPVTRDIAAVVIGVLITGLIGEGLRRLRLGQLRLGQPGQKQR